MEILKCKRIDLYLKFDQPLKSNEVDLYREWIARRGKFEPLQYIIGKVEFFGVMFKVTPDVLIPRPETEILVETVIDNHKASGNISVLDIGTGSGCIAVAVVKNIENCVMLGLDISEKALAVARENSENNGTADKVKWVHGDIGSVTFDERFDIVISNPPYVGAEEFATLQKEIIGYEPAAAVTDNNDGLEYYSMISKRLKELVKPGGKIYLEVGHGQVEKVSRILQQNGISEIKTVKDLQNIERVITGVFK